MSKQNAHSLLLALLLALLLLALATAVAAQPALAGESVRGEKPMAIPLGRFLAEIEPAGPGTTSLRVLREGTVLWEENSTAHGSELSAILDHFPVRQCRGVLLSAHTGGAHCCYKEALLTDCGQGQILTSFAPAHTAIEMEQANMTWMVHAHDWSFAYYMLDEKRHLPFAASLPITRVLVFDPQHGWRPEDPGDFPKLHRLLQRDLENTSASLPDEQRAARAIAASAHALLAGGSDTAVRQTLARLLPPSWLPDLDVILGDVIKAVSVYTPCENRVFRQ